MNVCVFINEMLISKWYVFSLRRLLQFIRRTYNILIIMNMIAKPRNHTPRNNHSLWTRRILVGHTHEDIHLWPTRLYLIGHTHEDIHFLDEEIHQIIKFLITNYDFIMNYINSNDDEQPCIGCVWCSSSNVYANEFIRKYFINNNGEQPAWYWFIFDVISFDCLLGWF